MNSTAEMITSLKPNEIFVFGSNMNGEHLGGAARYAYDHFGAIWGQGEGMQGQSYALPTMGYKMNTYSNSMLSRNIETFFYIAKSMPDKTFLLTKVGCGIAGRIESDIAPLFRKAPKNVIKPENW